MTYEEKLDLVINEIVEAKKRTRAGQNAKIFVTKQSELIKKIIPQEVHEFLLQLQDGEHILQVIDIPSALKGTLDWDIDKSEHFSLLISDVFDEWYEKFLLKKKSRPHNLDWLNLLKVLDVCIDIDSQLQITKETRVTIPSFPYPYLGRFRDLFPFDSVATRKAYQQHRWVGAEYLEKEAIVTEARYKDDDLLGYADIIVKVNISRFEDFYANIKQEFEKRKQKENTIDKKEVKAVSEHEPVNKTGEINEIVHQITYTKHRQILMNDDVQIGNPDFNSENDLVFSFLYENPNRRITVEEIENKIGGKLTKTLHKIVENLGFEGDTKKLFFSVSKGVIEFRNPVTKKDLGGKKPLIKLIKGGGKLIMPH